jgi:hypothetical protein
VADYDVGVTGLSVPPTSAPLTEYRPAVCVRNNGVHAALAFGSMRIYSAGLLIQTLELYSGTIQPGDTKDAQADRAWTPPGLGPYLIIADVTCDHDQYEPNNHLAPTYITVTAAPPPPPPPVALHAGQHEDGGADEVNIDGLSGQAAEPQTPANHKTSHQVGGTDQLDVTGLPGTLATPQPIWAHSSTHEEGGTDKVNVDGLHGILADSQTPKVHNNSQHDPNYTTVTEFGNHLTNTTAVHAVATNLEQVAHKGQASGYAGLTVGGFVPVTQLAPVGNAPGTSGLRKDQTWGPTEPVSLLPLTSAIHVTNETLNIILDKNEPAQPDGTDYHVCTDILLESTVGANTLTIQLLAGNSVGALTTIASRTFPIAAAAAGKYARADFRAQITNGSLQGAGITFSNMGPSGTMSTSFPVAAYSAVNTANYLRLTVKLSDAGTTTNLWVLCAAFHKRTP